MTGAVDVIVVNYGTVDLAVRAVESILERKHGGREVTVHLVDNASPGDDAGRMQEVHQASGWEGRVRLWLSDENLGFGRGNNLVIDALLSAAEDAPEFVFLLNPDAALINEAVDLLACELEADDGAGAAGAAIELPDGTAQAAAFRFPRPVDEVVRTINFGPLDRLFGVTDNEHPTGPEGGVVDWLTGAAVMFRLDALRQTGSFDPGFFLYYEEVDLMRRLHVEGWRSRFIPAARVLHVMGAATGNPFEGRKRTPEYVYRSRRRYFEKAHGRPVALAMAAGIWIAGGLNVLLNAWRRPLYLPLKFFPDHWRFVLRPLLMGRKK
ncbi:MAG: glycosyltransferase family 2 protein [Pseudomonadota bacterium]